MTSHDNVTDIVEQLRRTHMAQTMFGAVSAGAFHLKPINPDGSKAASIIEAQQADIATLRKQLEVRDTIIKTYADDLADRINVTIELRKQLENAREALNKADSALRGGRAIIVNQLPHAPWLRTMDEAIEAISALKGQPD